jgi:hypothetical protein
MTKSGKIHLSWTGLRKGSGEGMQPGMARRHEVQDVSGKVLLEIRGR